MFPCPPGPGVHCRALYLRFLFLSKVIAISCHTRVLFDMRTVLDKLQNVGAVWEK